MCLARASTTVSERRESLLRPTRYTKQLGRALISWLAVSVPAGGRAGCARRIELRRQSECADVTRGTGGGTSVLSPPLPVQLGAGQLVNGRLVRTDRAVAGAWGRSGLARSRSRALLAP